MSNEPISNKSWADDILPTAQHRFFPGQSHESYSNAGGGGHHFSPPLAYHVTCVLYMHTWTTQVDHQSTLVASMVWDCLDRVIKYTQTFTDLFLTQHPACIPDTVVLIAVCSALRCQPLPPGKKDHHHSLVIDAMLHRG